MSLNNVVFTDMRAGNPEARNQLAALGLRLAPHQIADDLAMSGCSKLMGPVLVDEMLFHPEKHGKLKKGVDLVDPIPDKFGRLWRTPASCIPIEATERNKISYLLSPTGFIIDLKYVTVLADPGKAMLLYNLVRDSNQAGIMDERSRMPLCVPSNVVVSKLPHDKIREIRINPTPGVRTILRDLRGPGDFCSIIYANYPHNLSCGIIAVKSEEPRLNVQADQSELFKALRPRYK